MGTGGAFWSLWTFRTHRTDLTLRAGWTFWAGRSGVALDAGIALVALRSGWAFRSLRTNIASAYNVHADEATPLTLHKLAFAYVR